MILEQQFVTYICIILGQCHVTFPFMETLSFFGRFVQKIIESCFQIHLFRKRLNNHMAAVMLQVIPSFYTYFSKNSIFISSNTYEKYIVSEEFCIACHDSKIYFLPSSRYHIILIGDIKELLQKLDAFCFDYQHVDCLYTLFKYRFSGKIVRKSGQLFDNVQRAVHFNHQHRGVERMPSIAKKRHLRKKYKKHLLSSFQNTKSTQTRGSVCADRIEQVKKNKFELELIKMVDCFLDGRGNYTSNLVSFKMKSL